MKLTNLKAAHPLKSRFTFIPLSIAREKTSEAQRLEILGLNARVRHPVGLLRAMSPCRLLALQHRELAVVRDSLMSDTVQLAPRVPRAAVDREVASGSSRRPPHAVLVDCRHRRQVAVEAISRLVRVAVPRPRC